MANTIEVTDCGDCFFAETILSDRGIYHKCFAKFKLSKPYISIDLERLNQNCPLKQSSITITLKTKENGE